ncbi:hypothetical protein PR048_024402 [Dryococelus australis]|uniref:Ig-like domain-containing protein n=1 Tax=Dryococelus australis TaxID=614101 RepID=A0ABQ9GNK7_9NEOP|nr:hypothetical protein PR048_024402 [Dryococelus australis]
MAAATTATTSAILTAMAILPWRDPGDGRCDDCHNVGNSNCYVVLQDYEVTVNDVFVTHGNVAVLKCQVPSFARRHVTVSSWLREEGQLGRTTLHPGGRSVARGGRFSLTSFGSLHVHDTVPTDGYGRYYCWVTDNLTGRTRLGSPGQILLSGGSTSSPALHNYHVRSNFDPCKEPEGDEPPVIEHSSASVRVIAGNTAELLCIGKGNPPPIYRALMLLQVVPRGGWFAAGDGPRLSSPVTSKVSALSPMCPAETRSPLSVPCEQCAVQVTHVVTGGTGRWEARCRRWTPTEFSCDQWYREVGGSLQEMDPGSVLVWPVQSVLQFPRAQPQHAGRYVCSVSSVLGEDRRQVLLEVSAPLWVRLRPQQQVADVGATASFSCEVSGGGSPRLSWLRNGRPVVLGDRLTLLQGAQMLTIHPITKEDRAMYQCLARGEDDSLQAASQLSLGGIRGSGGAVVRALASHHVDPCLIHGGFTPGFSHVGIVLDDAACRRVFFGATAAAGRQAECKPIAVVSTSPSVIFGGSDRVDEGPG